MKSPHKNIVLRAMFSPKMKVSSKSGNILVLFRKENFKTLPKSLRKNAVKCWSHKEKATNF